MLYIFQSVIRDVETVLTTYTNVTNHPKKITTRILKLPKRIVHEVKKPVVTQQNSIILTELPKVVTVRDRNETPEQKKHRKQSAREAKALITRLKKENKLALKEARKQLARESSKGAFDITNGIKYLKL